MPFVDDTAQEDESETGEGIIAFSLPSVDKVASAQLVSLESDETVIASPFGQTLPGVAVATNTPLVVHEAGTQRKLDVALSTRPDSDVVVIVAVSDATETAVNPATLMFTTENWNSSQSVTVTGIDEDVPNGRRFSEVTLTVDTAVSDSLFTMAHPKTIEVITTDDDATVLDRVWLDENANGIRDAGEPYLSDRPIELIRRFVSPYTPVTQTVTRSIDQNEDGVIDPETEMGWYALDNQVAGDYFIRQAGVGRTGQTNPETATDIYVPDIFKPASFPRTFTSVPGNQLENQDFSLVPTAIPLTAGHPRHFRDVSSVEIRERRPSSEINVVLNAAPVTDVTLSIDGCDPAVVTVIERILSSTPENWNEPQAFYIQGTDDDRSTGPQMSFVTVAVDTTATSGNECDAFPVQIDVTKIDNESVIDGRVWRDINRDGVRSSDEPWVNGQRIELLRHTGNGLPDQ